jgi:hypothetical protein
MNLNLPALDQLASCRNLLIAGMGGGFDLFCGLPIYFELQQRGQRVHLANFSFSDVAAFENGTRLTETLVGVDGDSEGRFVYFPEVLLARWFKERREEPTTIWCFHKTGTRPLLENYRALVEHLSIDGILLVDGGVDSLVRGDEHETGTLIEDAISLFAVNELSQLGTRLLACIGFGAERDLTHAHILENIAALTRAGGFWGCCSLTPQMVSYRSYEEAVLYVQGNKRQDPSVINSSIISAVRGHHGDYHLTAKTRGSRLWISPLMPLYWFFDIPAVARHNPYLTRLEGTETFMEAARAHFAFSERRLSKRPEARIPL